MSARRPRLLELFSGAGGSAMGWHRAGFEVDLAPQPRCPFEFHQGDAIAYAKEHAHEFDAIAGGPPCQFATAYRRRRGVAVDAVNLIPDTREVMVASGLPYVIENVEQARAHLISPVMCCGTALGGDIRRHRLFESNIELVGIGCDHADQAARSPGYPQATNRANRRATIEIGVRRIPLATQRRHMGIDWMILTELSQAIPPAYTLWLGLQLMRAIS
jgi:DNA (cytosine-5)-methyltransferase 1